MTSTSPTSTSPSTSNSIRNVFNGVSTQATRWFRHISEAAEAYKTREGKNRKTDHSVSAAVGLSDEISESTQSKKDSEETSTDITNDAGSASERLAPPVGDLEQDSTSASPDDRHSPPPTETSPSSSTPQIGENVTNKLGDGQLSPSQRRREDIILLTTEKNHLVQPSEVVVLERPVLVAEPVLTPIERLRRKDEEIRLALSEKQHLVADILHVPREEFENIAELAGEPSVDKEAAELVLAAVNHATQLTTVINEVLCVSEEETISATSDTSGKSNHLPAVPAHKLQDISTALNKHLTQLLKIVKERDEERDRLRRELQRSREQLHIMHENQRKFQLSVPTSPSQSRPSSYLSQDNSGDQEQDSEDDTGFNRLACNDELISCEEKHDTSKGQDEPVSDEFVDALSGEAESHLELEVQTCCPESTTQEAEVVSGNSETNY